MKLGFCRLALVDFIKNNSVDVFEIPVAYFFLKSGLQPSEENTSLMFHDFV